MGPLHVFLKKWGLSLHWPIYIYTHVHSHALTRTHMHSLALTCTCTHMHSLVLTCTHSHSHVLTHTHMHSLSCPLTLMYIHMHSCALTCTHVLTRTHVHLCVLMCTHSHELMCTHSNSCSLTRTHVHSHFFQSSDQSFSKTLLVYCATQSFFIGDHIEKNHEVNMAQFLWYDCTFKKQCTVPVTLTFQSQFFSVNW